MTVRLTKRIVETAPAGAKDSFIWDAEVKGFGVKVTPTGKRIYVLQYRTGGRGSATKRATIGLHGSPHTAETARREALDMLRRIERGELPVPAKRQAATPAPPSEAMAGEGGASQTPPPKPTVETTIRDFIERYHRARGSRAVYHVERAFESDVIPAWGSKPLDAIVRADVARLIDGIAARAPIQANRVFAYTRRFFNWCVERDLLAASPMTGMRRPSKERDRDRVLTDGELTEIWLATGSLNWPMGPMIRLLILTAQRREEVASLRWSELDLDGALWTLPRTRAKNDRTHEVPLSRQAVALLRALPRLDGCDLVFSTTGRTPVSGFSKAKARVDSLVLAARLKAAKERGQPESDVAALPHWVLHDFRRTVTTHLARHGVPPHVADRILNHVQGTIRGVAAVYNRHAYLDERRKALQDWADHVERITGNKAGGAEGDGQDG